MAVMAKRKLTDEEQADAQRLRMAWDANKTALGLSQEQVAFQCGWKTQGSFSQYLLGTIPLNLEALLKISRVLKVDPRTISPTLTRVLGTPAANNLKPGAGIPVVGTSQGGPDKMWEELGYPPGFGEEYLNVISKDAHAYALRVRGSSMAPRIREGDVILVEPNTGADPGDDVVVRTKAGAVMVKTLVSVRNDEVILDSISKDYERIVIPFNEVVFMHAVMGVFPSKSILKRQH